MNAPSPLIGGSWPGSPSTSIGVPKQLSAAEPGKDATPDGPPMQSGAGLPLEIADGVHALVTADGALRIPPQRWPQVQRDAARLVEGGWVQRALTLGWAAADLFGCDQQAPWYRLDRSGLILLTGGRGGHRADPRRPPRSGHRPDRCCASGAGHRATAAGGAVVGAPDLRSGHRATDPRADSTSERTADGGDVLGRNTAAILTTITQQWYIHVFFDSARRAQ